jgi:hypothetical protein
VQKRSKKTLRNSTRPGTLSAFTDWIGQAASSVKSNLLPSRRRTPGVDARDQQSPRDTRSHWEKMDVIAPIYRLAGEGLSDHAIALKLNLTENTVYGCIGYLLRRLKCRTRAELVLYSDVESAPLAPTTAGELILSEMTCCISVLNQGLVEEKSPPRQLSRHEHVTAGVVAREADQN